jgi:hypothetical protein
MQSAPLGAYLPCIIDMVFCRCLPPMQSHDSQGPAWLALADRGFAHLPEVIIRATD